MAAATVVEDLAAVPVVDSVAAADWVAVAAEDLLDFAAVMVEDGAAQKVFWLGPGARGFGAAWGGGGGGTDNPARGSRSRG